ncbi:GNAT family N-acetyltransferase [Acidaminobacter sp. JC074]|uniref:GNAT family N-acetyltransferase n=1 Tax=Acidaminobacter sp. JC074 TaxID=2530199 RepID=UPI001F0F605D|nr:GNAT family N-acetyltransferase [Acidaminobacter sp. JC074]MCH4890948.1 GNAT family N-acetyltransferase [Acidaminobacter sp. JC074]
MNNQEILEVAIKQSAADYNILAEDLLKGDYKIYSPSEIKCDARNYLKEKPYCNFIYYGQSLVAVVEEEMQVFIEKYFSKYKKSIYRCFDAPQITALNNELEKKDKCIAHIAQSFLPDIEYIPDLNTEIETRLFVEDEILELYDDKRFTMALDYNRTGERVDVIAIAAYVDGKIAGVAGATNDCKTMWQIGIDVLEEFRFQKIASTLTYLLSQEILKRGIVPFYCCAWSNLASKNTARKAGFKDAWIELTAKSTREEWIKNTRDI